MYWLMTILAMKSKLTRMKKQQLKELKDKYLKRKGPR